MAKLLPILQSKWFAAIFSAVSFLSISVFFTLHAAKTLVQKPAPAAAEQPEDAQDVAERNHNQPSWNFTNPEIDELVRDLREERGALAPAAAGGGANEGVRKARGSLAGVLVAVMISVFLRLCARSPAAAVPKPGPPVWQPVRWAGPALQTPGPSRIPS